MSPRARLPITVRRVRADEWERVRDLRLVALSDPVANLAFLGTVDQARSASEEFWRDRAAAAASSETSAQFIAELDGEWVGTATALVQVAGSSDEVGRLRLADRPIVVGVFVDNEVRGHGAVDALLDACAGWAREHGFDQLFLNVHVDNVRAHAAYARNGFTDTRLRFTSVIGEEREMVRSLGAPTP